MLEAEMSITSKVIARICIVMIVVSVASIIHTAITVTKSVVDLQGYSCYIAMSLSQTPVQTP